MRYRIPASAGVIVSEEHAAHPTALGAFRHACTAWEPRAVGPFTRLAEAVHEHGGRQLIQLYAPGLADSSTLNLDDWGPVWAPSAIVAPDGERSVAMAQADIDSMVAGFVTSASNVAAAGLDGVELHGAHGWLIGQFLSPMFNRRTDAYGGSTEARCRLALEIAQAVRDHRPGLVLGLQLSVDEYVGDVGITPEETDRQVEILAGSGLFDYLSLSTGSQFSRHRTIPPIGTPDAVLAEHGRRAREIARGRTAIALLGRIRHLATAARLLEEGAADIVAMTRAHLAEPAIVRRTLRRRGGHGDALRRGERVPEPRLRGPAGHVRPEPDDRPRARLADAALGRARPRRVTVVGAGPAGLRAAAVAGERGHEVTLLERSGEAGGHLALMARLPGRGDWREGVEFLTRAATRHAREVRLGVDATAARVAEGAPDVVLVATGCDWEADGRDPARPGAPPIDGAAAPTVVDVETAVRRALADPGALGRHVVVLDESGEVLPVGLAEIVGAAGARVEIVTRRPQVGARLHATLQAPEVFGRLAALDVHLRPGHGAVRIADRRVELTETWSGRPAVIEDVDTVVLALRRAPRDGLAAELRDAGLEVHVIGDARSPRRAAEAIHDGERIGRAL